MASDLATQLGFPSDAFPVQGEWSEADYFRLEADRFIELVNGCIEILPTPTLFHQRILKWLLKQFEAWCEATLRGEAFMAPVPMKLFSGTIREPDLFVINSQQSESLPNYPDLALVVLEVVSEGEEARKQDYVEKRSDYAKAGIPEYRIVDPFEKAVTVLKLESEKYAVHGRFEKDQIATAATLERFSLNCSEIWAQERRK